MYSNAIISNNKLIQGKHEDDPKPITYMGYTLDKGSGTTGILLMDEVNVTIVNNILSGGFGIHYNNVTKTFAIQDGIHGAVAEGPVHVEIKDNIFNGSGGINYLDESGKRWKNIEISGNMFYNVSSSLSLENAGLDNIIVFPPFICDFESGSTGWILGQEWGIEREDDNAVLDGSTHSWAIAGSISWSDYNFTTRFKMINGTAHITFRLSDNGRYYLGIRENYAYFAKEKPLGSHFIIEEIFTTIESDTWHALRLQINENNIQIFLDDAPLVVYADDDPLLYGSIGFETQDNSHFHFDDINVIVIPKHT
ncbi:MAG: hypothetical protein OEW62_01770 [Candidatus Bathyarchaeota archaeon]|nr:hypothetical protein [Candidatus Bathyarchaeota archaeon]